MKQKVLIIDKERDFCLLMQFYLSKRNCDVSISHNFDDGLSLAKKEKPDVIIADRCLNPDCENELQKVISEIENYSPQIKMISTDRPSADIPEYNDDHDHDYDHDHSTFLDAFKKLIKFLKDLFKR